ncbi:shikimate kinase [Sporosarcina thermotolerans]|uniref:Shikimate kinase n=1 Tax=Sporosarcina thermotolerans TaxID=633404 RepID=A0AAW9A8L4_9BACL|nr:shikimate kinase [Sporosarcina thermotolerans]MDW0117335.1 shikimate kinase [Sporosarcina thermotolerans]WHT47485.1 shikimate kinase [Sporosarcina thermotolerans]
MKKVYLVGFMGSGKSAIGKRLSTLLNIPFYDMDAEISEQTGMTIHQIFETYGEESFREMETNFLRSFHDEFCIIATGGGVAMREENRSIMRKTGLVFYLNANFRDIWRRVSTDINRPIVQRSSRGELESIFNQRMPLYLKSAHIKVETADRTLKEITQYIAFQIERLKN